MEYPIFEESEDQSPRKTVKELQGAFESFGELFANPDLREQVLALIPVVLKVRELGKVLMTGYETSSARDRVLAYLKMYPRKIIHSHELMVISGIQEYPRRIRELRVQYGYNILSGLTAQEMAMEDELDLSELNLQNIKPEEYVLLDTTPNKKVAKRWKLHNNIRRKQISTRDKILELFLKNVGEPLTGDMLRYVAGNASDWPRRVRELRTEFGWPIVTKVSGNPSLPIGVYILESTRQAPEHDRHIPEGVRRRVLRRDSYACQNCLWTHDDWNRSDPRHLEIHHIKYVARGGDSSPENLITLCTICHDEVHAGILEIKRTEKSGRDLYG